MTRYLEARGRVMFYAMVACALAALAYAFLKPDAPASAVQMTNKGAVTVHHRDSGTVICSRPELSDSQIEEMRKLGEAGFTEGEIGDHYAKEIAKMKPLCVQLNFVPR